MVFEVRVQRPATEQRKDSCCRCDVEHGYGTMVDVESNKMAYIHLILMASLIGTNANRLGQRKVWMKRGYVSYIYIQGRALWVTWRFNLDEAVLGVPDLIHSARLAYREM